tara:strand:- start:116 stop:241 length:126 start_codon:yes stop_codon:yes gene_type:complete
MVETWVHHHKFDREGSKEKKEDRKYYKSVIEKISSNAVSKS